VVHVDDRVGVAAIVDAGAADGGDAIKLVKVDGGVARGFAAGVVAAGADAAVLGEELEQL
jgi:pentose-5-phosphate-3-epimerase